MGILWEWVSSQTFWIGLLLITLAYHLGFIVGYANGFMGAKFGARGK